MRADPHHNDDFRENRPSYDENRGKSSYSSDSGLFRKSPLTIRTHTPPARCESPTIYPSSPPPSTNSTPLLTATLNAPVAYYNSIRVKSDRGEQQSGKKANTQCDVSNSLSSQQQQSATFYSALIRQLKKKTGTSVESGGNTARLHQHSKLNKEKTKPLPFVCPACRKRFQRHIAMNAHFQNEHISPASGSGERTCKLCNGVSSSLAAVRQHLRVAHNIDLDNPVKCLEDCAPPVLSVLEASLRCTAAQGEETEPSCSNIEMHESGCSSPVTQSPSPAHTPTSSESPERALFPVKQDGGVRSLVIVEADAEDDDAQVEDLSIRKPSPVLPRRQASNYTPPPPPQSPKGVKRARLDSPSPTPTTGYTCVHCNIVYPNQTLYFLHRGFHSDSDPWRCNSCGVAYNDLYAFNTHLFSVAHQ